MGKLNHFRYCYKPCKFSAKTYANTLNTYILGTLIFGMSINTPICK